MVRVLASMLAARLQEKKLMIGGCSRCRKTFISKRRDDGSYPKTCGKCQEYARSQAKKMVLSPQEKLAKRMDKRRRIIERDPLLKKLKENYVEYVPIRPSAAKQKHSPKAVKAICRQVRRAKEMKDKKSPWGL